MPRSIKGRVLIAAGSDSGGGAGIQADIKAVTALGGYAMTAITALTAQNTKGVFGVHPVPIPFLRQQLDLLFDDLGADVIKTGMLHSGPVIDTIVDVIEEKAMHIPLVVDPVMVAKGGHALLDPDAMQVLKARLILRAHLLTPNLPEAAALLDEDVATNREAMIAQGNTLRGLGAQAVLMKGGHLEGEDCPDLLMTAEGHRWLEGTRIDTENTHGTGCTLSSAIAAEIGKGTALAEAVVIAKDYVAGAIAASDRLSVGSGHGPTHHFHALWP